jgi:transcriptional repressor NrdR
MRCPYCSHLQDKVVDSREGKEGLTIRRRRQCLQCDRRFTSYERIDEPNLRLVKKDGRREAFNREKLMGGLETACKKRPVAVKDIEDICNQVETQLQESPDKELDEVAYVRFASVYRQFKDVSEFFEELKTLVDSKKEEPPPGPEAPQGGSTGDGD